MLSQRVTSVGEGGCEEGAAGPARTKAQQQKEWQAL